MMQQPTTQTEPKPKPNANRNLNKSISTQTTHLDSKNVNRLLEKVKRALKKNEHRYMYIRK